MADFKHILVPTDFSDASNEALDLALELARKFESKVTVVHAMWLPSSYYLTYAEGLAWPMDELEGQATKELQATVAKAKQRYANVEGALVAGKAAGESWERILDAAKERRADLIVIGTHGRRGLSRVLLGSVAEKIVRLSPVPVMTVSAKAQEHLREQALGATNRTEAKH